MEHDVDGEGSSDEQWVPGEVAEHVDVIIIGGGKERARESRVEMLDPADFDPAGVMIGEASFAPVADEMSQALALSVRDIDAGMNGTQVSWKMPRTRPSLW